MRLDRLAEVLDDGEVPTDCDGLAEAFRLFDRFAAKLSQAVGAFDASGEWAADFAVSCTSWLQQRAGMTRKAAASTARTARTLRELPVTSAAWLDGSLSGGKVQAIVTNVDERTMPQLVAQEAGLVPTLAPLSPAQTARAMRFWRARAEALVDDGDEPREPERDVYLSQTYAGRWVLRGDLDPEGGAVVDAALRLAETADAGDTLRMPWRRRGDALVDVCRYYLDHRGRASNGRERPHLNVVVDLRDLVEGRGGELVGGGRLDGATIRRLLCDASVHRVVTDGRSTILDYGTSQRTVPPHLRAALVLRDRGCRHDGCDRRPELCEAHHVVPVLDGGPTNLDNLVLKCTRHHHIGHQPGWQEKLLPDGTLVTTDPKGRTRTTRPPGIVQSLAA